MTIEVGRPCPFVPTSGWTPRSSCVEWSRDFMGIFIAHERPSPTEIEWVRKADIHLGVAAVRSVVFIVYKVGGLSGEAPYNAHSVPADRRPDLSVLPEGYRLLSPIFLIDSSDGFVCAIRLATMSARVSQALRAAVVHQIDLGNDLVQYNRDLSEALASHSTHVLTNLAVMDLAGAQE